MPETGPGARHSAIAGAPERKGTDNGDCARHVSPSKGNRTSKPKHKHKHRHKRKHKQKHERKPKCKDKDKKKRHKDEHDHERGGKLSEASEKGKLPGKDQRRRSKPDCVVVSPAEPLTRPEQQVRNHSTEIGSGAALGTSNALLKTEPASSSNDLTRLFSASGVGNVSSLPSKPSSSATKATSSRSNSSSAAATLLGSFGKVKQGQQLAQIRTTLRKEFTCPLCCDILYKPVTTPCGHSFCQACLLHMAVTGGNLINSSSSTVDEVAAAAVVQEATYEGVLKDFNCPLCRTRLPGFVAQVGVSVVLWDAVNTVFSGYAWQHRAEHEAELARARAIPTGAWASYYRQRLGKIVDGIEEGRDVHGDFDGEGDGGGGGNKKSRREITETKDGRVVVQDISVSDQDRFRRHAVAFIRFPRKAPTVRAFI